MKRSFLFLLIALLPAGAWAQMNENAATQARMERLERDLMLLQRQVARGITPRMPMSPLSGTDIEAAGGPAQLEVRLSALEEEIRNLRGKLEENQFEVRKLSENFNKLQRDVEFRFGELGGNPPQASPDPVSDLTPLAGEAPPAPVETPDGPTSAGDGTLQIPEAGPEEERNFATPRDHYNHAFRLLNQTKYSEAAEAFDAFTKKYPKDPLVGNAYYWQGETYYIRRDYVQAADNFRQGFEALPNGPKAADNLLKLAMSLNALERNEEACVVLGQVTTKFRKSSTSVTDKAMQEQKRIGC